MKKVTKIILIIGIFSSLTLFNGCEELGNIELNIPLEILFTVSGSETSASDKVEFCLNQYQKWQDNRDNIESASYLKAAYWTIDVSPAALKGTISFALKDNINNILISGTLPNVSPADYIGNPIKIEIGQDQIDAFNQYLGEIMAKEDPTCQNKSFNAEFSVTNITGGTPYTINSKVELVLAAEVTP